MLTSDGRESCPGGPFLPSGQPSVASVPVTINGFKIFWNILKYVSGGVAAAACSICAGVAKNVSCRAAQLCRHQPIRGLCVSSWPMRGGSSAACVSVWYVRNAGGMWAMSRMWRPGAPGRGAGDIPPLIRCQSWHNPSQEIHSSYD